MWSGASKSAGSPSIARWRGSALPVREERAEPAPVPPLVADSGPANAAVLLAAFEAEVRSAVPEPMAEVVCQLLSAHKLRYLTASTAENRAQLLTALDLVEDVLDALLLAGSADVLASGGSRATA